MYSTHLEIQGVKYPEYMDAIMTLHWSAFLSRQLDSITALELNQAHHRIAKDSGVAAARYAINCLRTVFNHAMSLDLIATNPAKRVKTAPAKSRDVYLDEYEIGLMRECLKEMAPTPRHFFLLAILTGMRRSNISGMKWAWVGQDTVTVPASESKNGEEMVVNLVPEAVEILKGRRALDPVYVFPSTSKINQPITNVYEWLLDLRRRMRERGCDKNFTIHDLRRSYAVRLVSVGASLPIIAKALGHRSVSSTPIYARASAETVRDYLSRV
jgi:integrase